MSDCIISVDDTADRAHRATTLEDLNEDVFRHMLRELAVCDMSAFSATCRWIREACIPTLFRRCYFTIYGPEQFIRSELFISVSLRPYIQYAHTFYPCLYNLPVPSPAHW